MSRSANASLLMSLGVSQETVYPIPSTELQIIADAIRGNSTPVIKTAPAKPLRKGTSLETAMKAFHINRKVNDKGDTLVSYHPNRPKYPFVYRSIRGARWKQTVEQAQRRFR